MAETYTLDAQGRTLVGKKVGQLRRNGLVPAVIYGAKVEPMSVQIPYRPLEVALAHAGGTHLININFDGKSQTVITREVQRDVLRGEIIHVDFLAVDATTRITADIAIHLVGESPAAETRIGEMFQQLTSLSIEALPADLVDAVEVDISGLKEVGDSIYVRDLNLSSKVTVLADEDELVVRINPMREVSTETEDELEGEEEAASEPEVIARGRAEDEEEDEE